MDEPKRPRINIKIGSSEWLELTDRRAELISKKYKFGLDPTETEELNRLAIISILVIEKEFTRQMLSDEEVKLLHAAIGKQKEQ